jgi:hypothetical protein
MVKQIIAALLSVYAFGAYADDTQKSPELSKGTWVIEPEKQTMTNEKGETFPFVDPRQEAEEKANEADALTPLERYTTALHYHGIPVDEAIKYAGQDYSGLLRLLRDPRFEDSWSNIVYMIGLIGDEKAVDELIAFAEDTSADSWSAVRAKAAAQYSLGILAGRLKSDRAVQYVIEGLELGKWNQRKDFSSTDPALFPVLAARFAVHGLAAAGTPKAIRTLESYSKRLASDSALRSKMKEFDVDSAQIDKSIRTAKKVQTKGFLRTQSEQEKEFYSGPDGK